MEFISIGIKPGSKPMRSYSIGGKFTVVEVKPGQTLSSELATSVTTMSALFIKNKQAATPLVVYGGIERQLRNSVTYLPWHVIQDYAWVSLP